MNDPIFHRFVLLVALLLFGPGFASAQEKKIEKAPIQPTSAASGAEMYKAYCAVCHGNDAKGDGPAAVELKIPPPNLSELAKRHGGKFPGDYVATVLRSGAKAPAHGTADMPVWGPLFSSISQGDQGQVDQRIANLTNYIKSLQVK
jgi:mono/diheme cytochrome c family protein